MRRRRFCRWLAVGGVGGLSGCLGRRSPGTASTAGTPTTPDGERPTTATTDEPARTPDDDGPAGPPAWDGLPPDAWPSFGGDPGNSGYRPGGDGPVSREVRWRALGVSGSVSAPAVVDGVAFVGSAPAGLHAVDAATGDPLWEEVPRAYVGAAPAVGGVAREDDGGSGAGDPKTAGDPTVYFADADGVAYAYSTDGEEQWTAETGHDLTSDSIGATDDVVVLGTAGTGTDAAEGRESDVLALDATTGDRRWQFRAPDRLTGPAFGGGRVYVGDHSNAVHALDAATGEELWSWRQGGGGGRGPVVPPVAHRGTAFVPFRGGVVALDWDNGGVRWRRRYDAGIATSPAVGGGRCYVLADATTDTEPAGWGTTETTTTTPDETPDGNYAIGHLDALDAATGDRVWRNTYPYHFHSAPTVRGGVIYVGGGEGIQATTTDGEDRWRIPTERGVDGRPAVVGGRVYAGSRSGHLYCVGTE